MIEKGLPNEIKLRNFGKGDCCIFLRGWFVHRRGRRICNNGRRTGIEDTLLLA